jgi:sulfotransferase
MSRRVHFISGLPRSGSTLLAALLAQNPAFHAGISSPVHPLMTACIELMSAGREAASQVTEEQKRLIVRGIFDGYYAPMHGREVIFDTNRNWTSRLPMALDLFPGAKVIACVRDVQWVMDSIERLVRRNAFEHTRLFSDMGEANTVYGRVESLMRPNRLVGGAWASLKDAFYGEQSKSLLVVEYEHLARSPEQVMRLIYRFIGEPWFEGHDYENVTFEADEFDAALGARGLHRIRPQVRFEPRRTILPPDLFKRFEGMAFWRERGASEASVIVPNAPAAAA